MKKFLLVFIAGATIYSCSHKTTPASTSTAAATTVPAAEVKPPAGTPPKAAEKMESPAVAEGKAIYTAKCGRCHGLKNPGDWTVSEWVPILDRMAPKSNLTAAEKASVTAYVNFYAKGN